MKHCEYFLDSLHIYNNASKDKNRIVNVRVAHPVIILVVMEVMRCQRCLRKRALKAKLYRSLQRTKKST